MEKVEPELEPKINNLGSATLVATSKYNNKKFKADQKIFLSCKVSRNNTKHSRNLSHHLFTKVYSWNQKMVVKS